MGRLSLQRPRKILHVITPLSKESIELTVSHIPHPAKIMLVSQPIAHFVDTLLKFLVF